MAARLRAAGLSPVPGRPPRPGFYISMWLASARKASAQNWKTGEGCSRGPLRSARVFPEARTAPTSQLGNPSLALRWLPAAVYPATAGATRVWGCGGGEDQGARLLGAAPTHAAARTGVAGACPTAPPRGAATSAGRSPAPEPIPPVPVCVCAERAVQGGWGHKGLGRGGWRIGPRRPEPGTAALMKCRLGSPRRLGTPLENANAIGKSRANRQNFY